MSYENITIRAGRTSAVFSAAGVMPQAWRSGMLSVMPEKLPAGLQLFVAPRHDATPSWTILPLTLLPGQTFCIRPELDLAGLVCPDSFSFSCSAAIRTVRVAPFQGFAGAKHDADGRNERRSAQFRRCRTMLGWRL